MVIAKKKNNNSNASKKVSVTFKTKTGKKVTFKATKPNVKIKSSQKKKK